MYIEASFFRDVILRSSKQAGAIYFRNYIKGEIALNKICLGECRVTNKVFAAGINAFVTDGLINHLNLSATCNNGNDKSKGYAINSICYGKLIVDSLNSSNNKCYNAPGLQLQGGTDQTLSQFCFFVNNTGSISIFIYHFAEHLTKNCIMSNNIGDDLIIGINNNANIHVYNSIFLNNTKILFIFIGSNGGNIAFEECYCEADESLSSATITNSRSLFLIQHGVVDFDICEGFVNIYVQKTTCFCRKSSFYNYSYIFLISC